MAARFFTRTIEEVTSRIIDYRGKTPEKTQEGVRLITAKVVKDGRILDAPAEFIAEESYDAWMRRGLPEVGDVLITTEAPLGEVAVLRNKRVALAQRIILLRGEPSVIDQDYLFHALRSAFVQGELAARATGTTVSGIKQSELRRVRVPLYAPPVQKKIAAILSTYDDLIENNVRRIRILEGVARALYREWFVEFRFPGHAKVRFIDSSLGRIPERWLVGPLGWGCHSLEDGDWIETKDQGGSDFRLLQVSNIGVGKFVETGNFRWISEDTFTRLRCTEIVEGDILVSRMPDPIGRAWLVPVMPWRMVTAVDVAIVRPDAERFNRHFCLWQLNSEGYLAAVGQKATGTTRARVPRSVLAAMPTLFPPIELQRRFAATVRELTCLAETLSRATGTLRRTRELLLPRLISGELDVSGLDIAVPESVA